MVFTGANEPRWMDLTIAYFTIPRAADDDRLWRWYNGPESRSVSLRPDRHGTTRAMLSIQQPPGDEDRWDPGRQKGWLRECFANAGWQTPRMLAGMDATDDFYLDVLRQVRLPRWSDGRVVLTGDAAWYATPLAGVDATLAITGVYVLAGELARTGDADAALAVYEQAMRPMVEEAQGVPKTGSRLVNPHTRLRIRLLHGVRGIASAPGVRRVPAIVQPTANREPDLSRYDAVASQTDGAGSRIGRLLWQARDQLLSIFLLPHIRLASVGHASNVRPPLVKAGGWGVETPLEMLGRSFCWGRVACAHVQPARR